MGCARGVPESLQRPPDLLSPQADGRLRCSSVPHTGHKARGTRHAAMQPCLLGISRSHARRRASALELGAAGSRGASVALPGLSHSRHEPSSWVLAGTCPGAAASPGARLAPPAPLSMDTPSCAPAWGCPHAHLHGWELCRVSVGAVGLGSRAGLEAGVPWGGCLVPSTRVRRGGNRGLVPHGHPSPLWWLSPQGRGRVGGWGVEASAPAQLPCAWAAEGGGGRPGAPARRCPSSPAALQECNQSCLCR